MRIDMRMHACSHSQAYAASIFIKPTGARARAYRLGRVSGVHWTRDVARACVAAAAAADHSNRIGLRKSTRELLRARVRI